MDFISEYARKIGKNTAKLNLWDMLNCYEWYRKEGGERKEEALRIRYCGKIYQKKKEE